MTDIVCMRCRELEARVKLLEERLRSRRAREREQERSREPRIRAQMKRRQAQRNAGLTERAVNFRKQWSGPELELASREDLTIAEVAAKLGRTYDGVRKMRQKLLDPADWRMRQLRDGPEPPSATS